MKAVHARGRGGLVYGEATKPRAGAGEALVRVHAAGVNPVDWKYGGGDGFIPGWDVSGVVEEVGPGASDHVAVGDEVYALVRIGRQGAYAEYVAVEARDLAPKPRSIGHVEAAAVPLAALTAWQSLFDEARLAEGQSVLVHGASGGVGSFAVQLAKARGARVVGTASARNEGFLRELGADEVVDHTAARFEEVLSDLDVVFDTVGGDTVGRSWGVLKPGGVLVSITGSPRPDLSAPPGARGASIGIVRPSREQLVEIGRLIDGGRVRPVVGSLLPLARAEEAHELSRGRHARGKIVLRVAG